MSTDLEQARLASKGAFDSSALSSIFYKHTIPRSRLDEIVQQMQNEPVLQNRFLRIEFSREDQFRYALKVTSKLLEIARQYSWTPEELGAAMSGIFGEYFPTTLHNSAFKYVIQVVGSEEQATHWIPKCLSHDVIGCYAQTELGHGSNVRKLETKAIYDPTSKDIVLSSIDPVTARKWWIGGLGVIADHAAVQAILYFPNPKKINSPNSSFSEKYINLGPHLFIVPIRDPVTRSPLKGVIVGDIGPKAATGFSLVDNGYLALDNVHIPVNYLLNRFTKIVLDNSVSHIGAKYVISGNPKVMYASMTNLRAGYPLTIGIPLAKAATIASRYLTIRRQFVTPKKYSKTPELEETQVIKYSSVYTRLVPIIALAHSIGFVNDALQTSFSKMITDLVENGDDTLLPEVHTLTSSLKGVISMHGTKAIEQCQILMGGHGFSYHSGIAALYGNVLPAQTFEGENYVVAQQTAVSLAKLIRIVFFDGKALANKVLFPAAKFLINSIDNVGVYKEKPSSPKTKEEWVQNDDYLISLFEYRTTVLLGDVYTAQQITEPRDLPHIMATASLAFGEQYIVTEYIRGAQKLGDEVIQRLARVLALHYLLENAAFLLEHNLLDSYSLGPLRQALLSEVQQIAPHAVALTDSFGFTDYELNSALGNYNGDPYKHLIDRASKSSLNIVDFSREIEQLKRAGKKWHSVSQSKI